MIYFPNNFKTGKSVVILSTRLEMGIDYVQSRVLVHSPQAKAHRTEAGFFHVRTYSISVE